MSRSIAQPAAINRVTSSRALLPKRLLLEDQVVMVTGGSRGIGRAIVKELAVQGAKVLFTYAQNRNAGEALVAELKQAGHDEVTAVQADVKELKSAQRVVNEAVERFGRLDALVNNAGVVDQRIQPTEALHRVIDHALR